MRLSGVTEMKEKATGKYLWLKPTFERYNSAWFAFILKKKEEERNTRSFHASVWKYTASRMFPCDSVATYSIHVVACSRRMAECRNDTRQTDCVYMCVCVSKYGRERALICVHRYLWYSLLMPATNHIAVGEFNATIWMCCCCCLVPF